LWLKARLSERHVGRVRGHGWFGCPATRHPGIYWWRVSLVHRNVRPRRWSKDWENLKAQLADLERVLDLETDYEHEAEMLRRARALFHEDDRIIVPRVHEALIMSTRSFLR
jgi:hypothetical protein